MAMRRCEMKKEFGIHSNPDQHWGGDGMLNKPTKDMETAPGWRLLQFLGFDQPWHCADPASAFRPKARRNEPQYSQSDRAKEAIS